MYAKLKMIGAFILGIGVFILSIFSYRAGKKSEQLDQSEANLEQAQINAEASAEGEKQFNEDVKSATDNAGKYVPLSERMHD